MSQLSSVFFKQIRKVFNYSTLHLRSAMAAYVMYMYMFCSPSFDSAYLVCVKNSNNDAWDKYQWISIPRIPCMLLRITFSLLLLDKVALLHTLPRSSRAPSSHSGTWLEKMGATVLQEVEKSSSNQKVASSIPCRSILEQDTEPLIAPHVQCAINVKCVYIVSRTYVSRFG